jgi:hypothetical protein
MRRIALILAVVLSSCGTAEVRGFPCSLEDNEDGSYTLSCSDGTSITISNGKDGRDGEDGQDGEDGESCSVSEPEEGTKLITCTDGTSVSVHDGEQGQTGYSCSVVDNGNGTSTVGCEDGTSATVKDGELCEVTPNGDGTKVIISCPNDYVVEGEAVIEGMISILDSVTEALVRNYSIITDSLYLNSKSMSSIDLPNLREIGNLLWMDTSSIETVELPAVTSIGEVGIFGNDNLQMLDLSALEEVSGDFRVTNNPNLPTCEIDELLARITVGGTITVSGNDDTATCD